MKRSMGFEEPWDIDPKNLERAGLNWERFDLITAKGHQVATIEGYSDQLHTPEEALRFARRIQSCVNAMEGVLDPMQAIEHARQALLNAAELLDMGFGKVDVAEVDKVINQCMRSLEESSGVRTARRLKP